MEESVITKILHGDIPGEIIYQDDTCAVLMTIEPLTPGHCLVIPKQQIDHLWDVDDSLYHHLADIAKMVASAIRTVYDYPRIGQIVEGFGVPHAHIHIFGLNDPFEVTIVDHVAHKRFATPEELRQEADKLRSALA